MSIEMPKGLPFSVDTWSSSSKRKRHHFLTHAHKDHSTGISSHFSYPIYSTQRTKTVLQHYLKLDESLFVGIKVGQSVAIDEPDGAFTDTAFDANHCPAEVRSCSDFGQIKNPSLNPSILDPEAKALSDTETKQWRIKLSLFHSTREEQRVTIIAFFLYS
ncbi:uncharacterized protein LOC133713665 isoform X2 [Rosa rugosa]|uniref:uncharacterized protein LOC133713665 isoform X2 n=1 Tax=Rosa rugosa TaxID=74645 RepID=UPI002B40C978|nr:uncharacterized protein LOC133713665 isoform X2 [Rosa rugosa]